MSSAPQTGLRPVKVQVAGQTLALRTDASAAYLRELAAMVDSRLAEVRDRLAPEPGGPRRAVSTQALALLCALQLADELRQSEAQRRALRRDARARVERILEHLAVLTPDEQVAPAPTTSRRRSRRAPDRAGAGAP